MPGSLVAGFCWLAGTRSPLTRYFQPNAEATIGRSVALLRGDLEVAGCPSKYAGEYPIDFHATRRSFASWLETNEVPGDVVDQMLGQAGTSVRKRHYSATDLEVMRNAVETIKLDLSAGRLIRLPVRVAAGTDVAEPEQTVAPAAFLAAPMEQAKSPKRFSGANFGT